MVPRKTWVSQNFGPILKSRKLFPGSRSLEFFSCRRVSDLSIFFPFALQKSNFSEFTSIIQLIELSWDNKTYSKTRQSGLPIAIFLLLSRVFGRLESRARNC